MKGDTPQDNLDKREVGEHIRLLRVKTGLTQEQLAREMSERLGKKYTPNMISLYENGQDHEREAGPPGVASSGDPSVRPARVSPNPVRAVPDPRGMCKNAVGQTA